MWEISDSITLLISGRKLIFLYIFLKYVEISYYCFIFIKSPEEEWFFSFLLKKWLFKRSQVKHSQPSFISWCSDIFLSKRVVKLYFFPEVCVHMLSFKCNMSDYTIYHLVVSRFYHINCSCVSFHIVVELSVIKRVKKEIAWVV